MVEAQSLDELSSALAWAQANQRPVLILGGGSNMLISDNGWPGLVIQIRIGGISTPESNGDYVQIVAGAGENWDNLVQFSVVKKLQGMECLSGIPGTVGASPIQNIGAYGQEVKDTIAWVEALCRSTNKLHIFNAEECGFAYRWSRFKGDDHDRFVVTRVAFNLKKNAPPSIRYGDLTRHFAENNIAEPSLADARDAVLAVRRSKGMVVDADIPDSRSCGSFFMNPIVSIEEAAKVKATAIMANLLQPDEKMPEFSAGAGQVKLSAAWLMSKSGLRKGFQLGNVGLSTCHVLALINRGNGSSAEILALVKYVQNQVMRQFGIDLHSEPVFVGFDKPGKPTADEA